MIERPNSVQQCPSKRKEKSSAALLEMTALYGFVGCSAYSAIYLVKKLISLISNMHMKYSSTNQPSNPLKGFIRTNGTMGTKALNHRIKTQI